MNTNNYLIKYTAYNNNGGVLKRGTVRAKNKMSEFDAMASFENHLIDKFKGNFNKLVVHECKIEQEISLDDFMRFIFNSRYKSTFKPFE